MKFKYNHQNNTLSYQKHELWYQIAEEQQFEGNFNSHGFILEPSNHWIQFTIYEKQIKVFYKCSESSFNTGRLDDFWTNEKITYYRQYLPKEEEIIFEFSAPDEVEKVGGKWVRKGGNQ